jgi:hypothetical protein
MFEADVLEPELPQPFTELPRRVKAGGVERLAQLGMHDLVLPQITRREHDAITNHEPYHGDELLALLLLERFELAPEGGDALRDGYRRWNLRIN